MAEFPAPLTPADCDLRGLPFMPMDVVRILDSDLFALSTGEEFKASLALWCKAWLQVPAASLPDDDRVLAHLSGAGSRWKKLRPMALRGWVKCSDGRFYHPVVAEKAVEAWKHRLAQRERVAKRWAAKDDEAPDLSQQSSRSSKRSERMSEARRKGTHTAREWSAMLVVCDHRCLKCGADGRLEKDHITPVYAGGSDAISNLQPLCPRCNCAKGPDQRDLRPSNWNALLHTELLAETPTTEGNSVGNRCIQGTGTGTVEGKHQAQPPNLNSNAEPTREKPPPGVTDPALALNYVCAEADWRPASDNQRTNGIGIINGWLALGCSLELILDAISKARKRDPSPTRSLKRFDSTIRGMRRDELGGELPVTSDEARQVAEGVAARWAVQ